MGDFADPIKEDMAGKTHYYLVQYTERKNPEPAEFLNKRSNMLTAAKRENEEKAFEEWKKDLMRRANKELLHEEEKSEESEGGPEEPKPKEGEAEPKQDS